MIFRLNVDKAIEAAGILLHEQPRKRTNYMRLLKLMYLAERATLHKSGRMITGDHLVVMKRGPLPSGIYNMIKGEHLEAPHWSAFIERDHYDVQMIADPGVEHLSRSDIETLQAVAREHVDRDEWEMVEYVHSLPEWRDPGDTSLPIRLEDILQHGEHGDDAAAILADAEKATAFEDFFSHPPAPKAPLS